MSDRPQLHAPVFGADPYSQWTRLARVLRFTAARHCPEWGVHVETIRPPAMRSAMANESHVANTQKMQHWHELVAAAPEGARLLLLDADTMILRPLIDLWNQPFDFAYTTKPSRFPFNSGVIAVRVSDPVRRFFATWLEENRRMLADRGHHQVWRKKYGGINQAALGLLLERGDHRAFDMRELPCVEWNCEDSAWAAFDPALTRIVHLKSALRQAIFFRQSATPPTLRLAKMWRALEQEAVAAECAGATADAACGAAMAGKPIGIAQGSARPRRPASVSPSLGVPAAQIQSVMNRFGIAPAKPGRPRLYGGASVTVPIRVSKAAYEACRSRAAETGQSIAAILRRAVEHHNI